MSLIIIPVFVTVIFPLKKRGGVGDNKTTFYVDRFVSGICLILINMKANILKRSDLPKYLEEHLLH